MDKSAIGDAWAALGLAVILLGLIFFSYDDCKTLKSEVHICEQD